MKAILRQSSDTEIPSLHMPQAEYWRQCRSRQLYYSLRNKAAVTSLVSEPYTWTALPRRQEQGHVTRSPGNRASSSQAQWFILGKSWHMGAEQEGCCELQVFLGYRVNLTLKKEKIMRYKITRKRELGCGSVAEDKHLWSLVPSLAPPKQEKQRKTLKLKKGGGIQNILWIPFPYLINSYMK